MSKLLYEIENKTDKLTASEKERLLTFLLWDFFNRGLSVAELDLLMPMNTPDNDD